MKQKIVNIEDKVRLLTLWREGNNRKAISTTVNLSLRPSQQII